METGIQKIHALLRRVRRDQRGITGLETAIVLIAFVVVASVFAYAVITTGLFSSEQAQTSAQSGVEAAKSTMSPKGSMILSEAQSVGTHDTGASSADLEDVANGAFIVEGVVIGDTVRNVTDGSSCTITAVTATTTDCVLAGGAEDDWDVGDVYEIDMDQVATVKFKVTPSPGAVPFSLASANTVVSFNDANNNQNATYLATLPVGGGADPFAAANTVYWTHTWLVGSGPAIDTGDVVEFTVAIKNLTKPLTTNAGFSVEVVPQSGSALAVSRTTPLEMALVMDLN